MTGINGFPEQWTGKKIRETSERAGIDASNLRNAIRGRRGLSLKAARQVAEVFNVEPVSLYVQSQHRAIKARIQGPESQASVLRAIAAVVAELKDLTPAEIAAGGKELEEAIAAMEALANQAMANATSAAGVPAKDKAATKSRDPFGRVLPDVGKVERDPFGRAVR